MTDKRPVTLDELVPTALQDELKGFAIAALTKMQSSYDEKGNPMQMVTLVLPRNMIESLIVEQMVSASTTAKLNALMGIAVTDWNKNGMAIEHSVNAGLLLMALQNYLERQTEEGDDV
jgi:hypothetical protein